MSIVYGLHVYMTLFHLSVVYVFLFSVGRDEERSEYCMVSTYAVSFVWTAVYAELVVIFCVRVNHTIVG